MRLHSMEYKHTYTLPRVLRLFFSFYAHWVCTLCVLFSPVNEAVLFGQEYCHISRMEARVANFQEVQQDRRNYEDSTHFAKIKQKFKIWCMRSSNNLVDCAVHNSHVTKLQKLQKLAAWVITNVFFIPRTNALQYKLLPKIVEIYGYICLLNHSKDWKITCDNLLLLPFIDIP